MASKFGYAGGIPERRVRPIWDAVDSRQYKPALKLAVALLAKHPNSPYALALKALILERMGKPDEALSVCLEAKELIYSDNNAIVDDLTLSTLQIVFQRLDRLDLATSCYEHASQKFPNNMEIMIGLFSCYVREYSFVKQQQTAMKMYKIVSEERFLLWAVCSILLQVSHNINGQKLLLLAEALVKKHIGSHSLHEPEALIIYISILEDQAKYDAALEVLTGNLGSLLSMEEDKLRIQGRLLARACNYAAAAEIFQRILQLCPDDWEAFLHYLGCLLENDNWSKTSTLQYADAEASNRISLAEEEFDSRLANAFLLVEKLQMDPNNNSLRGPYLASIEIEKRRRLNGKANNREFVDALFNYFVRFSHLSCFGSDVKMYLHLLNEEEKDQLLEKITKDLENSSVSQIKDLGRAISVFKVQESVGALLHMPVKDIYANAANMVKMYIENLPLSKDLDPQESMHGEELLTIASNALVLLFWRTKKLGFLLEAIMILEFGLTIRRYVWQYKIPLLHLYSHIGALPLAYEWYCSLDVKNILLETVSHHILPQLMKSPLGTEASCILKDYTKFMDDHLKEAADLTFLAYRHRNYSKVIEFVEFKEKLENSSQLLMARLDLSILQLKHKADNLEEAKPVLGNLDSGLKLIEMANEDRLSSLTFNEDLQSRPWWSPTSSINFLSDAFEEGTVLMNKNLGNSRASVDEDAVKNAIKKKSLVPRLVYLSIHAASFIVKEDEPNGSLSRTNAISELKCVLEQYSSCLGLSLVDATNLIFRISKGEMPIKNFESDIVNWMNFAVFSNAWNLSSQALNFFNDDKSEQSSWHIVDNFISLCISEQLTSQDHMLLIPGRKLPNLVQLISESFSWHILVIESCIRSMHPLGKKKKKNSSSDRANSPHKQAILTSVQSLIGAITSTKNWASSHMNMSEEQDLDDLLSHLQRRHVDDEPGSIHHILAESACTRSTELCDRISGALESWNSPATGRKVVEAQRKCLVDFICICDSKLKMLDSLRQLL